jgi:hypothetical protein
MLIDTLEILVNADASGLQNTLKGVLQTVEGTVNSINSEEVDWTSIFTRAVSPALISGVASMLAFAISQSLDFQQSLATAGTAAGDSASQIAQVGQAALDTSQNVPASAQQIASAMLQLSALFPNIADQQQLVAEMSQLSAAGFGNLSDIVSAVIPVFQQWGVTTTDQGTQVLTDLMHAAEGAKESIPALTDNFSGFSDALPAADKNLGSFNNTISTFASEIANLGVNGAQAIFQALATSATSAVGPMELLGVSFGAVQKSLLENGGLSAIEQTSTTLPKMGPGASLIATNFGLSAMQVSQFQTNAAKLPKVATDAKSIAANTQTIGDSFAQSNQTLNKLAEDWNKFKAAAIDLGGLFTPLVMGLAAALGDAATDFDTWKKDAVNDIADVILSIQKGDWKGAFSEAFTGATQLLKDDFVTPAEQLIGGVGAAITGKSNVLQLNAALSNSLGGTGLSLSNSQLSQIDNTASSNNMIDSLISALQTGVNKNTYQSLQSTFNLSVPAGSAGITAKMIATQLYNTFQGTTQ